MVAVASVDLVDETYIAVSPQVLATIVADPARWRDWWPDLDLVVFMDRGSQGQRWSVTGALVGSVELWLEPVGPGTVVHYYLRGLPTSTNPTVGQELPDSPAGWRRAASLRKSRALHWKRTIWALKDEVEGVRMAGCPPTIPVRDEAEPRAGD